MQKLLFSGLLAERQTPEVFIIILYPCKQMLVRIVSTFFSHLNSLIFLCKFCQHLGSSAKSSWCRACSYRVGYAYALSPTNYGRVLALQLHD